MPDSQETVGYVSVGIPIDYAFAEVNAARNRNVVWLVGSTLLVLALAWFGGDLLVRSRIRRFLAVTQRLSQGDLSARTGLGAKHDELGELGQSFDDMAEALQEHASRQRRAELSLRQYAERMRAMVEIGGLLNANLVLDEIVKTVCRATAQAMGVDAVSLSLYEAESGRYVHAADVGLPAEYAKEVRPVAHEQVENRVQATTGRALAQDPKMIVRFDVQADSDGPNADLYRKYNLRTAVSVGLVHGEALIGRLNLHTIGETRDFDDDEFALLRGLANQAAQALANARLYAQTRKLLEQTRHQSRQLEDVLNTVPEAILLLDRGQRIELANDTALACLPVVGTARVGDVLEQFGETPLTTLLIQASNGSWLEVSLDTSGRIFEFAARQLVVDDEMMGWVVVFNDVTDERARQARLRGQERLASVGQLAAGIAHDFNNILTPILIYVDLLLASTAEEARTRRPLLEIQSATLRAKDLIAHILTFSRQDATGELHPVQLQAVIDETMKLVRAALPSTIEIDWVADPTVGTVLADATQIHQMLMNLCTNAGHAMRERGGTLTVSLSAVDIDTETAALHPDLNPGTYAKLMVRDSGHGIDPALMARIFEPFFTTKAIGEGTGMGLAVVHGIVRNHHGAIMVASHVDSGSEFTVYLPIASSHVSEPLHADEPAAAGTESILVVDDESSIVEVVAGVLQDLGYRVQGLNDPRQALELVRSNPDQFDLVLSDLTMPYLTGDQLVAELSILRPNLPVVLVSGYNENPGLQPGTLPGVSAYLRKPFTVDALNRAIRSALDQPEKKTTYV